jgi:uncharacterized protein DUF6545
MPAVLTIPAVWILTLSLLWLGIVLRTRSLQRSPRQRAGALMFLCLALSATLTIPSIVRDQVNVVTGIADLSIVTGHLCTLLAILFAIRMFAKQSRPLRVGVAAIGVAMAVMVGLFLVIPRQLDHPDFGLWQARHPAVITYQMIYQGCLGGWLALSLVILVPGWRAARGTLRASLLLLWLGAVFGVVYVGFRMWYVLAHGIGHVPQVASPVYGLTTLLLLYAALLLAGAGALVRTASGTARYWRRYVAFYRLGGLWAELTEAVPTAVLEAPPAMLITSLELRLYRRTVEIRDAQLELSGLVPSDMRAAASALVPDELALDACTLVIALYIEREGPVQPSAPVWERDASLDAEVAALLALSRLMRDPAVLEAAAAVTQRPTSGRGPRRPPHPAQAP